MILYFSGTGNSLWAAKRVAEALDDELVYIPDAMQGDCHFAIGNGERLGFVIPVHGWRPPLLVRRFLERCEWSLPSSGAPYTYIIYTAGDTVGRAVEYFEGDLAKQGLQLDAAFSLIMPESYVGLPLMDVDTKAKEAEKKLKAAADLTEYIEDIRQCRKGIRKTTVGPLPSLLSGPVGAFFVKRLVTDKPFKVVDSRCTACGACAKACPVGNIDGGRGRKPRWRHKGDCLSCFACYHHCPNHAIEYGWRTRNKGQYYYTRQ